MSTWPLLGGWPSGCRARCTAAPVPGRSGWWSYAHSSHTRGSRSWQRSTAEPPRLTARVITSPAERQLASWRVRSPAGFLIFPLPRTRSHLPRTESTPRGTETGHQGPERLVPLPLPRGRFRPPAPGFRARTASFPSARRACACHRPSSAASAVRSYTTAPRHSFPTTRRRSLTMAGRLPQLVRATRGPLQTEPRNLLAGRRAGLSSCRLRPTRSADAAVPLMSERSTTHPHGDIP
jgi:hypothetical protein